MYAYIQPFFYLAAFTLICAICTGLRRYCQVVAHSNPAYIRVIQIYARRFLVSWRWVDLEQRRDVVVFRDDQSGRTKF